MEGFGVINAAVLNEKRPVFGKLSNLLDYPNKLYMNEAYLETELDTAEAGTKDLLLRFWQEIETKSLFELQQFYTDSFDFTKKLSLYMTFYKFEDARERGQMLSKLKFLYEMFGLLAVDAELTDFLPLMLEFYEAGDWFQDERVQDLEVLFGVMEDGTYFLLQNLNEEENPYRYLIEAVRVELKACLLQKEGSQYVE
ncbi:respiratory nitrate reductase subunit delta [Listeria aquatica FSL S10-1188]|uniref:Respiratory nitrate reductase subunit delta n=2 Tax=Listeria aquatica TaxID=1494960 RepID=W7B2F0_9LIST|nr:respiratory nitrate reductase subunit delta [Listeria aquatica FSL S10-1188]MBC1522310.1 nitrate reductase molybdenum cofactor assembly chaperone [Listeria aquatica]